VRFVGCALAWRPGEAHDRVSCLVVMDERGSIIANSFAADAEEVAQTIDGYAAERRGVIVGVDAPLAVPNERGTRRIERILSKVALPAYSASRKMFGGQPYAEELLAALDGVGVEYTDYPFPKDGHRGGLGGGAQDPGGRAHRPRRRAFVEQTEREGSRAGAAAYGGAEAQEGEQGGAGRRPQDGGGHPMEHPRPSPENREPLGRPLRARERGPSKLDVSAGLSHAELDLIASLLEGTLAAYTVHRHWRGRDGSMVVGTGDEGSVLLPAAEVLHVRVAEECRAAGVPYV
jgi:hypothetical protein